METQPEKKKKKETKGKKGGGGMRNATEIAPNACTTWRHQESFQSEFPF